MHVVEVGDSWFVDGAIDPLHFVNNNHVVSLL